MWIRSATDADLDAVMALLRTDVMRTAPGARPEPVAVTDRQREAMRVIAADPTADVLVGEVDGRIVATTQVNWLQHLTHDGGLVCQLEAVRVEASMRGRGFGAALMEHVLAEARRRGAVRAQLTTMAARTDAHRFYQRLGFAPSHVGMKRYLGAEDG